MTLYYRNYKIIGQQGYYRFETINGMSISNKSWKTLNGIKNAIDQEFKDFRHN